MIIVKDYDVYQLVHILNNPIIYNMTEEDYINIQIELNNQIEKECY